MEYACAYLYDDALYRRANRLHLQSHLRICLGLYSFLGAIPLIGLGFAWMAWSAFRQGDAGNGKLWVGGAVMMGCYSLLVLLRRRRLLRKRMREGLVGAEETPRHIAINEEGLRMEIPGKAQTAIEWPVFCDVACNEEIALLYPGRERFFIVTRADEQQVPWADVCQYLREHVHRNGKKAC